MRKDSSSADTNELDPMLLELHQLALFWPPCNTLQIQLFDLVFNVHEQ